jgi:hypothetical protein
MGRMQCRIAAGIVAIVASAASAPAMAQVLIVEPNCGVAGQTSVNIRGSGWAEPNPPCHYDFYFDGGVVAAPQPDGLFGPPMTTFVVPAGAQPGEHFVRVELRIDEDNRLVQCRKIPFKVVSAERDPYDGQINIVPSVPRPTIYIGFNPHEVCDVTPCDAIQMIQVVRIEGITQTGSRTLTPSEVGVRNGGSMDPNVTPSGQMVDNPGPRGTDPYYTGPRANPADQLGTPGEQGDLPIPASMTDSPWLEEFPADVTKIVLHFEVNLFCSAGTNRGEWIGQVRWRWERSPGGNATITVLGQDRSAPSQGFLDAVDRWNQNRNNRMPPPKKPTKGGRPC